MAPIIEKILEGLVLMEGPHWDSINQCLYFVSITESTIHKYVPATKRHTQAKIGNHNVSIIIPVKNSPNRFIVSLDRSLALIQWDGESKEVKIIKKLCEVDEGTPHVFNDGKCDKTGRIWIGSMGASPKLFGDIEDGKGTLYSFQNSIVKSHRFEIGISNGLAFDYESNKMYYNDSFRYRIDQYDIDFEQGTLSNMKTIFTLKKNGLDDNLCDGMTMDNDGNLWVALFGEGKVIKVDPRIPEKLLQVVELPALQTTSVAFGGPNLDELYVTSAKLPDRLSGNSGGALFRVTGLNVKGLPMDEAVI